MPINFGKIIFALDPNVNILERKIAETIRLLSTMYHTGCFPRVVLDGKGKVKDVIYHWPSKEVYDNYILLQSILALLLKEQARNLRGKENSQ